MSILTTIDELKKYVEVSQGLKFDTVKPSLRTAETRILKSYLGDVLYNRLLQAYSTANKNIDTMAAPLSDLAGFAQNIVANIAMSIAVSRIGVQLSDSGVTRMETASIKTAFQYQEVNLRESYQNSGFDAVEDMLSFLESKKADFADWVSSPAYLDYTKYLIRSADQFSAFYNIRNSRLAFMAVRYIMRRTEDFEIKEVLGEVLLTTIKTQLKDGTLSTANQAILDDYIRPAVALITISRGVFERALDISENGVTVSTRGNTNNNQLKEAASMDKMEKMADQLYLDGNKYLQKLAEYITAHPDDFPGSGTTENLQPQFKITNKLENGIFGV